MNRHERRKAQALGQPIPPPVQRAPHAALQAVLSDRYTQAQALAPGESLPPCVAMGSPEALMYWGLSPTLDGPDWNVTDLGLVPPGRYLRGARKYRVTRK